VTARCMRNHCRCLAQQPPIKSAPAGRVTARRMRNHCRHIDQQPPAEAHQYQECQGAACAATVGAETNRALQKRANGRTDRVLQVTASKSVSWAWDSCSQRKRPCALQRHTSSESGSTKHVLQTRLKARQCSCNHCGGDQQLRSHVSSWWGRGWVQVPTGLEEVQQAKTLAGHGAEAKRQAALVRSL
jgi:hypothetical protein